MPKRSRPRATVPRERRFAVPDWYAFTLSFKGVVLEGLEVVFIALTFGTNQHNLPLASLAAGVAVLVVAGLGVAVRAPLARVPENSMKFVVGVMLTAFGTFWGRRVPTRAGPAPTPHCRFSSRRMPSSLSPWSRCCDGVGSLHPRRRCRWWVTDD